MQIIVIGCGKVGSKLATVLSGEGHDVVIIDSDRKAFNTLEPDFNGITISGVPIDQDVLKKAGIETADALAAVTPDDNINIMACQVAKEFFKVPRVVARIYNPEREQVFHHFGLETICPTNLTVDAILPMILGETGASQHIIGNNLFFFKYVNVAKKDVGKKLGSYKTEGDASIFGVLKRGRFEFVNPELKLGEADILVVAQKAD